MIHGTPSLTADPGTLLCGVRWLPVLLVLLLWTAVWADTPRLAARETPGSWPTPRQNRRLTAFQPLPGEIRSAPEVTARLSLPTGTAGLNPFASRPGGPVDRAAAIVDGSLHCYDLDGKPLWQTHPRGLQFESLVAAEDLDRDGRVELALTAGRPRSPLGAAVLVDATDGSLRFRYDVEPMSYWWTMKVDSFLPGTRKQLLVVMHGYPPDKKYGYTVLFEFPRAGEAPKQRWRYDFDAYTCFPSILTTDLDGDGVKELCLETHSRMWILDALTGKVRQFIGWDVKPANVRSYGLVRFLDLNGDGREDFLCIGNFAQHHEVLLNEGGRLKLAWAHGWDDSVTTRKIATLWPEPPVADVDGDGKLELVVSMFGAEEEPRWVTRVYDAVTGAIKSRIPDRIATDLADLDGDGRAEMLAEVSTDPTRAAVTAACLLKQNGNEWKELWREEGARSASLPQGSRQIGPTKVAEPLLVRSGGGTRRLVQAGGAISLADYDPPVVRGPDLSRIKATVGLAVNPPLVADLDGDGTNEIIVTTGGKASVYHYDRAKGFTLKGEFPSDVMPAVADMDGDGRLELVVGTASAGSDPHLRAYRMGSPEKFLWDVTLHPPHPGIPHARPLYFQTGRFTGGPGDDLYVYTGTPVARSLMLDGRTGKIVWEKGESPGISRYYAPTTNHASVWDVNGDGKDDLVFTDPDYYCAASGPTGEPLLGPLFPPKIFDQPSQGLYTLPAILENGEKEPTVCLVDGHYFVGVMTLHAKPMWYRLPETGEARSGAEGFLRLPDGTWLMGYGREDGRFACIEVATGKVRWELPLEAAASQVSACDIDGDGRPEFLFGTSHGDLYALGDGGDRPRVVWKASFPASVGAPVVADVDGDGKSEILVTTGDGALCLLNAGGKEKKR